MLSFQNIFLIVTFLLASSYCKENIPFYLENLKNENKIATYDIVLQQRSLHEYRDREFPLQEFTIYTRKFSVNNSTKLVIQLKDINETDYQKFWSKMSSEDHKALALPIVISMENLKIEASPLDTKMSVRTKTAAFFMLQDMDRMQKKIKALFDWSVLDERMGKTIPSIQFGNRKIQLETTKFTGNRIKMVAKGFRDTCNLNTTWFPQNQQNSSEFTVNSNPYDVDGIRRFSYTIAFDDDKKIIVHNGMSLSGEVPPKVDDSLPYFNIALEIYLKYKEIQETFSCDNEVMVTHSAEEIKKDINELMVTDENSVIPTKKNFMEHTLRIFYLELCMFFNGKCK